MPEQSRRKFLKSVAAGGGAIVAGRALPETWTRPVVEAVVLPAHAQMSETPTPTVYGINCNSFNVTPNFNGSVPVAGTYYVQISYLPTSSSALDTGNPAPTHYDAFDDIPVQHRNQDINNTEFNQNPAGISFTVVNPSGFINVVVRFQDQATYGTANCDWTYAIPG